MRAKMASTYGWTHSYIKGLPISVFMDYWLAITPIEANNLINQLNVVSYPHMSKKTDRQKYFKSLKSMISSTIKKTNGGVKSMGDIYKDLARKLNGR